jgi:glycosyltransferase involved in cell wall biosynthesis
MIVFLSPIFQNKHFSRYPALSVAANKWCSNLLKEMNQYSKCITLSHINDPLYPKGNMCLPADNFILYNSQVYHIPYINMPIIRNYSLKKSYISFLEKVIKNYNISCIISYNQQLYSVAEYLQKKGIKWVCIYADANSEKDLYSNADKHIYLSYRAFDSSKYSEKIHFDGGIYSKNISNDSFTNSHSKRAFLYSGAIHKENGVDLIIDAFKAFENDRIELWICGKGNYSGFIEKIQSDIRIKYYGLVSEKELENLYTQAFCYLNLRLNNCVQNNYNFPSKLFDYLSYGKPIISTFTEGISPAYEDYLIITNDREDKLKDAFETVLAWDDIQLKEYSDKIKIFQEENSWNNKVRLLWKFIQ